MDAITLAMLNNMKKSGGVGHIENSTITWDGDETGKVILNLDGVNYALVSNTAFTADQVEGISVVEKESGETHSFDRNGEFFEVATEEGGLVIAMAWGIPCVFIVPTDAAEELGLQTGIYFICGKVPGVTGDIYASSLKLKTIHPIDPKFLPGVCLPVVELETVITADGAVLTEAEANAMNALKSAPFVLKAGINITAADIEPYTLVMSNTLGINTTTYFATSLIGSIVVTNDGGTWVANYVAPGV